MKKLRYIIVIIVFTACLLIGFTLIGRSVSDKTKAEVFRIGQGSTKITVMQISDLHYPKSGCSLEFIYERIDSIKPDLIFITGDTIDSTTEKQHVAELDSFFAALSQKALCFAVLGNHEAINENLRYFKQLLSKNNITLLENDCREIQIRARRISIAGVSDKVIYGKDSIKGYTSLNRNLPLLLLAHRPEKWPQYLNDTLQPLVTFGGHAHGGQFRIFGQGLYSPGQGAFPKFDSGLYHKDGKYLVVSRGLGDSVISYRLYNSYHLPVAEIYL